MRKLTLLLFIPLFLRLDATEIKGDLLYWFALKQPYEFTSFAITGGQQQLSAKPSHSFGLRVTGHWERCKWFADFGGLYLNTSDTIQHNADGNIALMAGQAVTQFMRVRALVRNTYWNVDARGGYQLHSCFYAYGNLRFVDMELTENTLGAGTLLNAPVKFRQKASFEGIGFGVGIGSRFPLLTCGYLKAEMGFFGYIGERKHRLEAATIVRTPNHTCAIPASDLKLAIGFVTPWCDYEINGEVGYDVQYFWDALPYQRLSPGIATNSSVTCINQGFAGPYARLGVKF